ncbi:TPA: acylneuraminate cytidylyltransferase family protein [archaeon]|uniref:Acylneuraminate cytidylyltransferase family protein n=1 Tax=Candidatus Naiadarchaeum limnaeum TaxID=2756139 RepID=A0A832USG1_9ARCH|nr:acylneuraminate cytidylyltransferase family protein [Candidatus Naiadarchaeales archaeon SRR2090153.bin1042]HIK00692.1 acylneuraminate cytidylyltransferase family protein [Candidatus Naiadarchaeum limnaeum]
MKIVSIICARGGSKGVPKKNIKLLAGKPLIAYTIEQSLACKKVYRTIVSTDNVEIAKVANDYGAEVPFMRPKELATDNISKIPALQHAINFIEDGEGRKFDIIVDMDPTSPFREVSDIEKCISTLKKKNTDSVVTVYESHHNPYFNMLEPKAGYLALAKKSKKVVKRRQDAPKVYQMNACVFVSWRDILMKRGTYFTNKMRGVLMPIERSLMIDTEYEFKIADFLMRKKLGRK